MTHNYLITGPEQFFVDRAMAEIKSNLSQLGPFDQTTIEVNDELARGDLTAIASPTLLGGNRLLMIEGSEALEESLVDEILAIAMSNDEELWLVFRHRDGRKNRKLLTELKEICEQVEANEIKDSRGYKAFVVDEVARYKRKISPDAVDALRTSLGDDLGLLAGAINQITASTTGNISLEMVAQYFDGIAQLRAYHVTDPLWAGDLTQALEKFRWLVLHDGAGANIQVVAALASDLRTMVKIMGAQPGQRDNEIAAQIGMPGNMAWKVPKLRAIARGWKPSALAYFTNRLAEIDAQIKGSAAGAGLDENARTAVVEKFLIDIARR